MSKGSKSINHNKTSGKTVTNIRDNAAGKREKSDNGYLVSMHYSPRVGQDSHWFQMVPITFFTAVIIIITRMASYDRPLSQFYFWSGEGSQSDFFSYYKSAAIIACAVLVLLYLLYRVFVQAFYIKRSYAYIPMIVYSVFVLLSYAFCNSNYKVFAMWGWVDRFEGTVVLISYMLVLFFVINTVNSEKNVKWVIYPLGVTSALLGLLGITQALNHDFFKTTLGKMLITPSWFWDKIDSLNFTFTDQIYQTVYNINYVSFYLTLLIPVFGILFIRSMMLGKEEPLFKKIIWGALFSLLIYNLIGSASSGGLMGMAFVVLVAVIVLNKRLLQWRKPVIILVILTLAITGITVSRWLPEFTSAVDGVLGAQSDQKVAQDMATNDAKTQHATDSAQSSSDGNNTANKQSSVPTYAHKIDYMETSGSAITLGYNGDGVIFKTYPDDPASLTITDLSGKTIAWSQADADNHIFRLQDDRFNWISVRPAIDDSNNHYVVLITDGFEWPFLITESGVKYRTGTGKYIDLHKVPAIGWENNQSFGSGRGYIWSRTVPMLKDTLFLGHGADTYCIYYPQNDYVGKYNSGIFSTTVNIIVDKPHNMYFGAIVGTGGISMLALLVLWLTYLIQSFRIYRKEKYKSFVSFVGVGIFLGICGFLVSGLVNDSSVSVMPMFYGLLGTGIAINMMLRKQTD
jgi:Lipid A core - O-antigen ligase and related enzymes